MCIVIERPELTSVDFDGILDFFKEKNLFTVDIYNIKYDIIIIIIIGNSGGKSLSSPA